MSEENEENKEYVIPEILHTFCPLRYSRDGLDYCGASDTPCEYCADGHTHNKSEKKRKGHKAGKAEVVEDVYE